MHSCYFRALRLGGVLTSPQAAPSGLQMTPPSLLGTENQGMPGSPDFILIVHRIQMPKYNKLLYVCLASCLHCVVLVLLLINVFREEQIIRKWP